MLFGVAMEACCPGCLHYERLRLDPVASEKKTNEPKTKGSENEAIRNEPKTKGSENETIRNETENETKNETKNKTKNETKKDSRFP